MGEDALQIESMNEFDLRKQKQVSIDNTDPIEVIIVGGSSSVHTTQAASLTEVTIAATNSSRVSVQIHNNSSNTLYIKYGTGVSAGSFTFKLRKDDWAFIDDFRGQITGVWNGTNGNAQITETS